MKALLAAAIIAAITASANPEDRGPGSAVKGNEQIAAEVVR